jgi:hypothetical protein
VLQERAYYIGRPGYGSGLFMTSCHPRASARDHGVVGDRQDLVLKIPNNPWPCPEWLIATGRRRKIFFVRASL